MHRIFIYIIILGSFLYGLLAVQSVVQARAQLPQHLALLQRNPAPAAQRHAQYLRSRWYQGEQLLTMLSGMLFVIGAAGLVARASWSRLTLFGAAWVAMAHMAWMLIVSMEWFRASGAGMLYQINLVNIAWVLLMLALAPTERLLPQ